MAIDGALYYPYIRVPENAWFSRVLLYWDNVATIIPEDWIDTPEKLGPWLLELVERGLVTQLLPEYADLSDIHSRFDRYLNSLPPEEIDVRRRSFYAGEGDLLHESKALFDVLWRLEQLHLAVQSEEDSQWWTVESETASDYMAALALDLARPGHQERVSDPLLPLYAAEIYPSEVRRVPITDQAHSFLPLLRGTSDSLDAADRDFRLRAEGQGRYLQLQAAVLEHLFPAPVTTVPIADIEAFRRKHGDLLPSFRRYVEAHVDDLAKEDDVGRLRIVDRMTGELAERVKQAEAYLKESRIGRIVRSPWCALVGHLIPVAGRVVTDISRDVEDLSAPARELPAGPLAYAAFAAVELPKANRGKRVAQNGSLFEAMAVT